MGASCGFAAGEAVEDCGRGFHAVVGVVDESFECFGVGEGWIGGGDGGADSIHVV